MPTRTFALAAVLALAAGCAPNRALYHWGAYDERLYRHYRTPADRESWVEGLKETILQAEQRGLKVPPGLYAEYGYALFEEGRHGDAVAYFQKERDTWPESRPLMEKMIRNAERRAGQAPSVVPAAAQGPAGALERTP